MLDTAEIARRVARPTPTPYRRADARRTPLNVSADEVVSRAGEVLSALAESTAYWEKPDWDLWLDLAAAAGLDAIALAGELPSGEALLLAQHGFDTERDELAMAAYESAVASELEPGRNGGEPAASHVGTSDHWDLAYAFVATRRERAAEAVATLMPIQARRRREREAAGFVPHAPIDEPLVAILRFAAGAIDARAARSVLDAAPSGGGPGPAVLRAFGLHVLRAADALDALAAFNRQTRMSHLYARELKRRYAAAFDAALARSAPKTPRRNSRKVTPGFVLKPSQAKTRHVFAPALPLGPACPDCGHGHRAWLSLDVTADSVLAPKLPGWVTFLATACLDCGAWMRRHDLRVDERGAVVELEVEPGNPHAPFDDDAMRAITPVHLKLAKATRKLVDEPLDGQCQLGGDPAWIQEPVDVHCRGCGAKMIFVARLAGPTGFAGSPVIAGDSGALYYFACAPCRRVAHLAQWT